MAMNWIENTLAALAFGIGLGMLGASCPPPDDPSPDPSSDPPPPPPPPVARTVCERACQVLHDLDCEGGEDVEKCSQTCEDTEVSGVARFCPAHVERIESCDELEAAFEACE